jgi:SAM-dependent methyltransferase
MTETIQANTDQATVAGFGDEWSRFDQTALPADERQTLFDGYFALFPWDALPANAVGADIGCGSGRWAALAAPRVGTLHCVDPSEAIDVARRALAQHDNVQFHRAGVDELPFEDNSLDFAYSLGVLHHIPDTKAAMQSCVNKLKPGAPFLVYLYYAFDNRPAWFRAVWKASEVIRAGVSKLPHSLRQVASEILAFSVYWPLSRAAYAAEKLGINVENWPLSGYRHRSLYTLRTDALDRFGTRLEQRFTRAQIEAMMADCGLGQIVVGTGFPHWSAVGIKQA